MDNNEVCSVKDIIKKFNSDKQFLAADLKKSLDGRKKLTKGDLLNEKVNLPSDCEQVEVLSDDESSSDEDEDTAKQMLQYGRYINVPEIVDEMRNFIRQEETYCRSLEDLVENYIKMINTNKFDVHETFGCIEVISTYQNNTFLPALKSSPSVLKIADNFIMHKKLFKVYYDNYFMTKPNIILILNDNPDVFKTVVSKEKYKDYEYILFKSVNDRVHTYSEFLKSIRTILSRNLDVTNFDRALEIIESLQKHFSKRDENTRFVISELVQTERTYVEKLETLVKEMLPFVRKLIKPDKVEAIVGNLMEIYPAQQSFYEAIKRCLFDFNPDEVGRCFLEHEGTFTLYIKDQKMKNNPDALEACIKILQKEGKSFEFQAPLNRLYKYKLLLNELRKSCVNGGLSFSKVKEAYDMIVDIICKLNGVVAINLIKDENIDLDTQGQLILRDAFVVSTEYIRCDAVVFLFEKSIVITQPKIEGSKKNRRDAFIYLDHIVNKYLALNAYQSSPTNFHISFYGKYLRKTYTLQAKDPATKDNWIENIEDILINQFREHKNKSKGIQ